MRQGTIPETPPDDRRTLGWEILKWAHKYIRQPDGPNAGEPFKFTREQVLFLLWFYAVDDNGKFIYTSAVLRRSKGWGKSPFMAALAIIEVIGPCRFGGWGADGTPRAVPVPLPNVQLAAVSLEQVTRNLWSVVLAMLAESPAVEDYGLDVGKTRIYVGTGGGLMAPVSSGSRSLEGPRATFVVMDETQHWVEGNGGHDLAEVIRRNLGKSRDGSARSIEGTNAHAPGEDSVAERSYEAMLAIGAGRTKTAGLLYDSVQAPPGTDLADEESLRNGLRVAYGDATWLDEDRLIAEIWDPRTPTDRSRRFYLNEIVAASDSWASPQDVDACTDPGAMPALGTTIALGFDGSKNDDSTSLVGATIDGDVVFEIRTWSKPEGPQGEGWEVNREQVDDMVAWAFAHYDVTAFFADVHPWESYVDKWAEQYGQDLPVKATARHPIGFDMRSRKKDATLAAESFLAELEEHKLILVDAQEPHLTAHLKNAKRWPNNWGVSFGKESRESPRKVDAGWSAVLARAARAHAIAKGVDKPFEPSDIEGWI